MLKNTRSLSSFGIYGANTCVRDPRKSFKVRTFSKAPQNSLLVTQVRRYNLVSESQDRLTDGDLCQITTVNLDDSLTYWLKIHCYPQRLNTRTILFLCFQIYHHHHHHHHHVTPLARISLTLSRHPSLSFIASDRSSGLHPVSAQSCRM